MNKVQSLNLEALAEQYQSAVPFPSICIDNFFSPEFANELASCYPKYEDAKAIGREFKATNENLKVQITEPAQFPEPIQKLCEILASKPFIEQLEKLTGISGLLWDPSFAGGGMHLTNSSGLLDVHVDFNFESKLSLYRRINILFYLNHEWDSAWGGDVELWNKDVTKCEQSFAPILNRCVIFSTSDYSFHGVKPVTSPNGITRNSFAVYYYAKEAGDNSGQVYGGHHTTIFKARPTEKIKKYVTMPADKISKKIHSATGALKHKLKNIV